MSDKIEFLTDLYNDKIIPLAEQQGYVLNLKAATAFKIEWMELCRKYEADIIFNAWVKVKTLTWREFFQLGVWKQRLTDCFTEADRETQHQARQEQYQARQTEGYTKLSFKAVVQAFNGLVDKKITRNEFAIICEGNGLHMREYRDFLKRQGRDPNGYAQGLLGLEL